MPDLFIKPRNPDGSLGDPIPAFGEGKTTEQKLAEAMEKNEKLERDLAETNQSLLDFVEFMMSGGVM